MTTSEQIRVLCVRSGVSLSELARRIKQNNQTTTSDFPCNFNFTVSNMNRFNQGIDHG